jgi:hypothetical protein
VSLGFVFRGLFRGLREGLLFLVFEEKCGEVGHVDEN